MILDYEISNLSLLLHDILSTIINKMRVKDNINCDFCLIETYSIIHSIWKCRISKLPIF